MKPYFRDLNRSMGKYRCVTAEGDEDCLAGELGEIWLKGGSTYKCLVVLPAKGEKIYTFDIKDLNRWVTRLKVPVSPADQLVWANNPNLRLDP